MKTQVWFTADNYFDCSTELLGWKRYMLLNERKKPCIIVIPKSDGSYECYSKLFLKSAICLTDKDVMRLVGSFL